MTTLSNRQYPLLRIFVKLGENKFMSLTEAATLDQRPFRSLLMRGWIRYEKGYGFTITWEGREAWRVFGNTDIVRANPLAPLCAWFYRHNPIDPPKAGKAGPRRAAP